MEEEALRQVHLCPWNRALPYKGQSSTIRKEVIIFVAQLVYNIQSMHNQDRVVIATPTGICAGHIHISI